ncbi:hypothetical protein O1611_g6711 [Lasiodiplodia mahajangana]|uniref:Uncharacterized protein n=1 Tax=Lasiodiplodia mahajangana TaxID=1108764 RepID=A0ACC2JHM5_9PEZI|nr:hypothetical protein O1611_g6711 [Lasiodiplodia mahajangana]
MMRRVSLPALSESLPSDPPLWPPATPVVVVAAGVVVGGGGGGTYDTGLPVVASMALTFLSNGIVSGIMSCVVAGKVASEPDGTVSTVVIVLVILAVLCRDAGHEARPVDIQTMPVNVTSSSSVAVTISSSALADTAGRDVLRTVAEAVFVTDLAHASARVV